ncbi:MAG: hypothetical protein CVT62_05355 [Actinobacteria bacterium HGW-Actinobacteria-2]|nr:MAG: hypothetical protein CVT62_05355 [Actinobacteria bacterium HGW-Actinobacteria-2]
MSVSDVPATPATASSWRLLYKLAVVGAILVVCVMPAQAAVFLISPPPQTVLGFFELFRHNPLLGMLDLDLLLTIDYLAMIPLYLALFVLVREFSASAAALGLVTGLFSLVLFFVTRDATFSMWQLSTQYATATDPAQAAALLAAGQMLLTSYNGGTFTLSYLLGAASTLIYSATMLKHRIFGRAVGVVGIITGVTMLVPANLGPIGLTVAMLSLIPTAVWLVLIARAMRRISR